MHSTDSITRREFVASGTAVAAVAAISAPALANNHTGAATHTLPAPKIARVIATADPTKARLSSSLNTMSSSISNPTLTVEPLADLGDRVDNDASITIELFHPDPKLYSVLYSAHNITKRNASIPATPAAIQTQSRANAQGQILLRVTQSSRAASQSKVLALPAVAGQYILAIPTASKNSNAHWRFTTAHRDTDGRITSITNPLQGASSRCAALSITINA